MAVKLNVAHKDELIVAFDFLECFREYLRWCLCVPGKMFIEGSDDAGRSIKEPFTV